MSPDVKTNPGSVKLKATVHIAGTDNTVKVETLDGCSIADALRAALEQLDLPTSTADNLTVVRNGDDAEVTDKVNDGDVLAASGYVNNG